MVQVTDPESTSHLTKLNNKGSATVNCTYKHSTKEIQLQDIQEKSSCAVFEESKG